MIQQRVISYKEENMYHYVPMYQVSIMYMCSEQSHIYEYNMCIIVYLYSMIYMY